MRYNIILIPLALLLTSTVSLGKTIYVDDDATGANDGSSWQNAYIHLQDALADANSAEKPVEIRVTQGIYKPDMGAGIIPGDRMASFELIEGVAFLSSYGGIFEIDPNERDYEKYETILSGDLDGNDIYTNDPNKLNNEPTREDNSNYVITAHSPDSASVLDGFTVTGGNGKIPSSGGRGGGGRSGGGIKMVYGKLRISNCTITKNVGSKGGGIYIDEGKLILINCIFRDNIADSGGGFYNGSNLLKLVECTFENNYAQNYGGGMYESGFELFLDKCYFIGNSAMDGGGMYTRRISDKKSFKNSVFGGNSAEKNGGAIFIEQNQNAMEITHSTFAQNSALHGKAIFSSGYIKIRNSILYNGGQDEIWNNNLSTIEFSYSDIQNGQSAIYDPNGALVWGEGNIDIDPLFADPNNGDYHLKSQAGRYDSNSEVWIIDDVTSPCIDAGDPMSPIGLEPFPNGGRINMGAYGGTAEASKTYFGEPVCETIIAGDINGDCRVDFIDIEILLRHWLEEGRSVSLKVIDGIEFHVQTDKTFYQLSENVQMEFTVTNQTDETILIGCSQDPELNLMVDKDGINIWRFRHLFRFFSAGIELTAGESKGISHSWDMKNDDGYPVKSGTYQIVGIIYNGPWNYAREPGNYYPTEVRIPITISGANEP